jgi:hypothetical protein
MEGVLEEDRDGDAVIEGLELGDDVILCVPDEDAVREVLPVGEEVDDRE